MRPRAALRGTHTYLCSRFQLDWALVWPRISHSGCGSAIRVCYSCGVFSRFRIVYTVVFGFFAPPVPFSCPSPACRVPNLVCLPPVYCRALSPWALHSFSSPRSGPKRAAAMRAYNTHQTKDIHTEWKI